LQDKLLIESLDTIEREAIAEWESCPARDTEGRELIWQFYKAAKKFRGVLQGMAQDGKMVQLREVAKDPNVGSPRQYSRR